ncbi:MAG: glycoside hydrolase [Bryobacteraceae bacterium]|nr:glycoside hydrolase [Bryobacteraceae bacterium]
MRYRPLLLFALSVTALSAQSSVDVYRAGQDGYDTFRIPALITTPCGTLLAFAEGRKDSKEDSGNIDVVLRRSRDGGKTWSAIQIVADHGGDTIGNPTALMERKSGAVVLLLTGNPGKHSEGEFMTGKGGGTRTVWITSSKDDGETWAPAVEITSSTKKPEWGWYSTGPNNGIHLRDGRLVVPCAHSIKPSPTLYSHVIYSDDRGRAWKIGGSVGPNSDESAVFERRDGSLMLNTRSDHDQNGHAKKRRGIAISTDRGESWSPLRWDETLIEPVRQGSILRFDRERMVLFSNPADEVRRMRMTVRLSYDDGESWPASRVLHEGPASYSSLAVLRDGSIACLYESGVKSFRESLTLARFPLSWLEGRSK